jgi:hypothetical protein
MSADARAAHRDDFLALFDDNGAPNTAVSSPSCRCLFGPRSSYYCKMLLVPVLQYKVSQTSGWIRKR